MVCGAQCGLSEQWNLAHGAGAMTDCDFNQWYGGKKANLPALVCLDSEHARYGAVIVAVKFNQYANNEE